MSSIRLSDVNGVLHFEAFKPWLAAIPKNNRTCDAVEDAAVDFLKQYETKYGTPMTPTIFEAFCHAVVVEIYQHKLWPVSSTPRAEATVADLAAAHAKMESVSWGEEFIAPQVAELDSDNEYIYDEPTPMVANPNPWAVTTEEALENFEVPDLTLRKGIYENFPVVVKQLNSNDGTERYAVEWHHDNLWTSFEKNARGDQDFLEWKETVSIRLLHSLNAYGNKYSVEAARDENQICVIAMVHQARVIASPATTVAAAAPVASGRRRALDVLKTAPVSWERNGATHNVKLHAKKCREFGLSETAVKKDLLANLAQCADCTVSSASGFLCVVTML